MNPPKRLLAFALAVMTTSAASAQTEFHINDNGLIYPDSTVAQLRRIVDSLNIKFKTCDLSRSYHAVAQTTGHYFNLTGHDAGLAMKDIEGDSSFGSLVRKYPQSRRYENMLLTRKEAAPADNGRFTYSSFPFGNQPEISITPTPDSTGKWVYQYLDKRTYGEESIRAFYFSEPFYSQALALQYARLVQYADCMIDTTTGIFTSEAYRNRGRYPKKKQLEFLRYIERHSGQEPGYPADDNIEKYKAAYEKWERRRDSIVHAIANTEPFKKTLASSLQTARQQGSNDYFEAFVERYVSSAAALELKRSRIVVGSCSMDASPRYHAFNIARLSASAVKWDVFLRAHLDIMNDRFERGSDGSYAWKGRGTYIRELEVLDINLMDLMAGIALRVADASPGHYYGSISRVGRALADARDRETISHTLLAMISDDQLDAYNRCLLFYLFLHYTSNLQIERERNENMVRLREAVKTLPVYLLEPARVTIEKFAKGRG